MKESGFSEGEEVGVPKEGDIMEFKGKKYRWTSTGYTVREFFSHSTEEKGAGPGWDFRKQLLDNDWALKNIGRTFTLKEVYGNTRETLPDIPFCEWEPVEE